MTRHLFSEDNNYKYKTQNNGWAFLIDESSVWKAVVLTPISGWDRSTGLQSVCVCVYAIIYMLQNK